VGDHHLRDGRQEEALIAGDAPRTRRGTFSTSS
jgi:hypothetical protein